MRLTWRQRLMDEPGYCNFTAWPVIDPNTLPVTKRRGFLRNRHIVAQALAGRSFAEVAAANGVDLSLVSVLLQRSLGGDPDGAPRLTMALVPGTHIRPGRRRKALPSLAAPAGARGAFQHLLATVPGLQAALDTMLVAAITHDRHGQNVTPQIFHAELLRLLRDAHWPEDTYPFTAVRQGYETARRYYHRRGQELQLPKPKPTRVIRPLSPAHAIYQDIHIDEHTYDAHTTLYLSLDGQIIPLRVSRVTLILAVDAATDCYLAYQLCLTQRPNQYDLLALLRQLRSPWQPLPLTTPGLQYAPGACLPSALGTPFILAGLGVVRLDNALAHLAHSVRDFVCEREGATLNLGLPNHPKGRHPVEHAFDLAASHAHRLPSTTGSHPHDVLREARKNLDRPPTITLRALEEALSVTLTEHNVG